jgi:hypothetical protein
MAGSAREEIYKATREGQDKYTYFLLAAAGAAVAFAVTQSQTATLTWSKVPLALAVLSWAFSFVQSPTIGVDEIYMPGIDESRRLVAAPYFDR